MTSNTQTPDEVRRALAEALGWHTRRVETGIGMKWELFDPDDNPIYFRMKPPHQRSMSSWCDTEDDAWALLPDWPHDSGAALALCLEVLDRLNAQMKYPDWRINIDATHVVIGHYVTHKNGMTWEHFSAEGRDAEALSRLALSALEDAAQDRADDE